MKETLLTISAFARLSDCTRQNISSLVKKGLLILTDGKLDTENETNKFYLSQRKEHPRQITNPGKEKIEKALKGEPVEVKKPKVENTEKKVVVKKERVKKNQKKKHLESDEPEKEKSFQQQKLELEVEKLKEQRDKLRRENEEGRAELVRRESLGDTCFGYLAALNQNIMSIPKGMIDEFESALKSGSTRSELINTLTSPICESINETKSAIKKEIRKAQKLAHLGS